MLFISHPVLIFNTKAYCSFVTEAAQVQKVLKEDQEFSVGVANALVSVSDIRGSCCKKQLQIPEIGTIKFVFCSRHTG